MNRNKIILDLVKGMKERIKAQKILYVASPEIISLDLELYDKSFKENDIDTLQEINKILENSIFHSSSELADDKIDFLALKDKDDNFDSFDIIFGDFPLGTNYEYSESYDSRDGSRKIEKNILRKSWEYILESMSYVSDNGIGIFYIEPNFWGLRESHFRELLAQNKIYVQASIQVPNLLEFSSIEPLLIILTKQKVKKLFILELSDSSDISLIIDNMFGLDKLEMNLKKGAFVSLDDFRGFKNYKYKLELENLKTSYKNYSQYRLSDVAVKIKNAHIVSINGGDKVIREFKEQNNSIYLPKILPKVGSPQIFHSIIEIQSKHQNYIQIILDESIILSEYAALFYSSSLGVAILRTLAKGETISTISWISLKEDQSVIGVPSIEEQKILINTNNKISLLKDELSNCSNELSINPKNASIIEDKLDGLLGELSMLSDSDKVNRIVRKGEYTTREFKETLSLCIHRKIKDKEIERMVLKTIGAFLNTDGGELLVGVNDLGEILGVDKEIDMFHKNIDKFLLHFKNLLQGAIGEDFYPFIKYKVVNINFKNILWITCIASPAPCYLNNKDFYVRTNPATDKLEGPKMVDYINNHFDK